MPRFKRKYHMDYSRSAEYVARESEAFSKLLRNLAKDCVIVEKHGLGVMKAGIVDGYSVGEERFDFVLIDEVTGRVICYVEVTGDVINDIYAYILSEKVEKAKAVKYPVWFMYEKRAKRMWRMFPAKHVLRHGRPIKWLEDEKPYYRVEVSKGWYFGNWVRWIRLHILKAIRDSHHPHIYERYVKAWVV